MTELLLESEIPDFEKGECIFSFHNKEDVYEECTFRKEGGSPRFNGASWWQCLQSKQDVIDILQQVGNYEGYNHILELYGVRPKDSFNWCILLDGKLFKGRGLLDGNHTDDFRVMMVLEMNSAVKGALNECIKERKQQGEPLEYVCSIEKVNN